MTSELRVDNLKGSTTGGSINVLGEGTSATTNLQQGLGKLWCHLDMNTENTIDDSFNTSSIEDRSTGKISVTATNAMASINYTSVGGCWNGSSDNYGRFVSPDEARTTTVVKQTTVTGTTNPLLDCQDVDIINFGDLA